LYWSGYSKEKNWEDTTGKFCHRVCGVEWSIRERYPSSSGTYVGFKEAEEAFGLI